MDSIKSGLKKLTKKRLLHAEKVGVKAIGREGRGWKTAYYLTEEGKSLL